MTRFQEALEAAKKDESEKRARRAEEIAQKRAHRQATSAPAAPANQREPGQRKIKQRGALKKIQSLSRESRWVAGLVARPEIIHLKRGKRINDATDLLRQMCVIGFYAYDGGKVADGLDELVERGHVVRVTKHVYVITRAGRLAGSGQDAPVIDDRKKRRL
jgi:hypothetical protein